MIFIKGTWFLSMEIETFKFHLVMGFGVNNYDFDNYHKCQTASDWVTDFYLSHEKLVDDVDVTLGQSLNWNESSS